MIYSRQLSRILIVLSAFLATMSSIAQAQTKPLAEIPWSATQKLSLENFQFRKATEGEGSSNASFAITYKASGADLLSRNLNKRVYNYFIPAESWIDTTQNREQALQFQQTNFDICEIYVRQFRKALYENKKQIKSLRFVDELNERFTTAFSQRRLEYDRDTKAGTDAEAQKKWEAMIREELASLSAYSYEKE
ncbi:MAG TPA: hypothetical protein VIK80_02900 [Flavihumibacter sp.]